jgi:hypothetical protein
MQEGRDHADRPPEPVDPLVASIFDQLITSVCVDVSFKIHRMIKTGEFSRRDLTISSRMELYPGVYENEEEVREALDEYATELPAKRPRLSSLADSNGDRETADKKDSDHGSNDNAVTKTVMTRNQTNPQTDIWGRPPRPPNENVECSVCNRQVSTVRFAPHLDKCMGIGTTSRAGGASTSSTRGNNF